MRIVLTALLILTSLLTGIVAYLARRIDRELAGLAADLRRIGAHVAPGRSTAPEELPSAAAEPAEPAPVARPVRRRRARGPTVVLPNGRRRIDYIRDRYYGDGADRSTIRNEIDAMLEEAGADARVRYQVVYAATTSPTDPRGDGAPGGADR